MKLFTVCLALATLGIFTANAEVFWFEAEEYDEEKSNTTFVEKGLNVSWSVKDDKDAFNKQYMVPAGGNRDVVEAAAGLVYIIPSADNPIGWQLWMRCKMPTTGSDSFFYQLSQDGGNKWGVPTAAHGAMQFQEWTWHLPWAVSGLQKGKDNALRIGERESNFQMDVVCLRNDGQTPNDDEYEDYTKQPKKDEKISVQVRDKLPVVWGMIKM